MAGTTTTPPEPHLEPDPERDARIRQLLADALLKQLDSVKRFQDIRLAPWQMALGGMTAGAALFAAGAAFWKLLGV